MAPSLEEPILPTQIEGLDGLNGLADRLAKLNAIHALKQPQPLANKLSYVPGRTVPIDHTQGYEHEELRPRFPDLKWPAIEEVQFDDRGKYGDTEFRNLLAGASDVFDYNPKVGTEIHGVKLSQLTAAQKDDLARLIATRGCVFFRDQDDFDVDAQRDLMKHFGTLHRHATTAVPRREGLEDVHVVYAGEDGKDMRAIFGPSFLWHSDVTYEVQPLAYTSLKLLTGPVRGGGGDTLWSSQYAAYDVLSAPMQKYLESLSAIHSADMQAEGSRAMGRPVRRDPINTIHPLVRTHPVTGWKALFFNPGFVTKIVGVPKAESDHIIAYLNDIISTTQEFHARFQWNKNDVVFWDNRICNHTATYGFSGNRRHAVRVGVHGERPVLDPSGTSQEQWNHENYGAPLASKDCSGVVNYND